MEQRIFLVIQVVQFFQFYDEMYLWEQNNLITHKLVRHEQGAAHAADALMQGHWKCGGVCFATSGPEQQN